MEGNKLLESIFTNLLLGLCLMFLWNIVMPSAFGLSELNYWQGWALSTLITFIATARKL